MKLAFDNLSGAKIVVGNTRHEEALKAARESTRKRIILPIHRLQSAPVQRMINYLQPGTYIRPHMHPRPGATESLVLLQGSIRFFTFSETGVITSAITCEAVNNDVLDIEEKVWHSFVVLEPDTMLFECKLGPYDVLQDKVFAAWAPEEFSPGAEEYINMLMGV